MTEAGEVAAHRPLLVLEASLAPTGAALVVGANVVAQHVVEPERGRRGDLYRAMTAVLLAAGFRAADLGGIVVGSGPGSFTGTRVAYGLAHGLRLATVRMLAGGADSAVILRAAAGLAEADVVVAIPWGRLRVMLLPVPAGANAASRGARVVTREDIARETRVAGATIVTAPGLEGLEWPKDVLLVATSVPPVQALATLVAQGAIRLRDGPLPAPTYAVPPDAVLPPRMGRGLLGGQLVPLSPEDLSDVARIERASFRDPWSEAMLLAELTPDDERMAIGVRRDDGALQGFALARYGVDAMQVLVVATDPAARGSGVGRALVREIARRAREAGYPRIDLEVRAGNAAAIALYATEGFVGVGRRRRYYQDGEDALLMSATIAR